MFTEIRWGVIVGLWSRQEMLASGSVAVNVVMVIAWDRRIPSIHQHVNATVDYAFLPAIGKRVEKSLCDWPCVFSREFDARVVEHGFVFDRVFIPLAREVSQDLDLGIEIVSLSLHSFATSFDPLLNCLLCLFAVTLF